MNEEGELQQVFQRDINCLLDEDRNLRKKGLTNLNQNLFKKENSDEDIHRLFQRNLLKNLVKVMSDKVEKNRELAIEVIAKFFDRVKNIDTEMVNSIIKEVTLRLNVTPFPEQSEEIRLALVRLLMKIFKEGYTQSFSWNLSDIAFTISKVLTDSYADIKRECSQFVIDISQGMKEHVGHHSAVIIKSLVKNLSHQHSKVRKMTIESLGEILLTRNAGEHLKEVMPAIRLVVNDKMSEVRKSSYLIVGRLLNQFSPALLRDFESELVRLLINGLSDDNEEIIKVCQDLLENVGKSIRELEIEGMKNEEGAKKDDGAMEILS